jgi:transcriptional regulator with XRE-family HTH domain
MGDTSGSGDNCQMAKNRTESARHENAPSAQLRALGVAIAAARKELSITQEQLAELADLSVSQISRFESGLRRPYIDELLRIAHILATPITTLLGLRESVSVPVTGLVGAGALVEQILDSESWDAPTSVDIPTDGELAALLVRGDSQYPRFLDGEYILYDTKPVSPAALVDQYAIVQTLDGRKLIKIIRAASGDKWNLISHNAPIETVGLLAAWRYLGAICGKSTKAPNFPPPKTPRSQKKGPPAPPIQF